jgi:hypothetical protein
MVRNGMRRGLKEDYEEIMKELAELCLNSYVL